MEKFLHNNNYAVAAPCFTLGLDGCVLKLNAAAEKLAGPGAGGRHLSTILADAAAVDRLLHESRAFGFSLLLNQSPHIFSTARTGERLPGDSPEIPYNIFASLDGEAAEINVFIYPDRENSQGGGRTKSFSDKVRGQKLLQTVWNEMFFSRNFRESLDTLVALIGKYLGAARVRIIEINSQAAEFVCTHQWTSTPEHGVQNPYDTLSLNRLLPSFMHVIRRDGVLLGYDLKKLPLDLRRFLERGGTQSILGLPLDLNGKFHGVLSCVNITDNKPLSTCQVDTMLKMAKIISLGMSRHYNDSGKRYDIGTLQAIISRLDTCIGVVDKKSNKVLFANDAFINTTNFHAMGTSCWNKAVVGNDAHCARCSLADKDFKGRFSKDVYLKSIQKWLRIIHEVMYWAGGVEHILFSAEDITAIKLDEQRLRAGVSIDPVSGALSADTGIELLQKLLDNPDSAEYGGLSGQPERQPFIAVLTLDHYATIQHSLGPKEAIALLKKIGICIKNELNIDELCRLSDNEFLLFPRYKEDRRLFEKKLRDLLRNIRDSENTDIARYSMEASFVLAQAGDVDTPNAENLIRYARYHLASHKKEQTSKINSMLL